MVRYYFEDIKFQYSNLRFNNAWLRKVAENENCRLGDINIIFCSSC